MVVVTVKGESYYMYPVLKKRWDKIKDGQLTKRDDDRVYIVDGRERSGKSVFALQQAAYIDPTIIDDYKERITFTPEDTLAAIRKTKSTKTHTKVIIFDEAFRGMSSKSALSKVNKKLVQAMMEMGQNNVVLFIVSPYIYLLELYAAVLRSHALFHININKKSKRREFRIFNYKKKAKLYNIGTKKGWDYKVGTKYRDKFSNKYPGGKEFEMKYRKLKHDSIRAMDAEEKKVGQDKYMEQRNILIYYILKEHKLSQSKFTKAIKGYGLSLDSSAISKIYKKTKENTTKTMNIPMNYI